jgi:hypothetical protein
MEPKTVGMPGGGGGRAGKVGTMTDCEGESKGLSLDGGGPSGIGISSSLVTSSVPGGSSSGSGTSSSRVVVKKKEVNLYENTPHTFRIWITIYFTR